LAELAVRRLGGGPRIVLVHGGVPPESSWRGQEELAERWELVIPWRRGFGDSPPPAGGRIDFEQDAADIAPLVEGGAHLAAFSYGGAGAALAAAASPREIRSLTLIEPALFSAAASDPLVAETLAFSDRYISGQGGEEERRRFLKMAGLEDIPPAALAELEQQVGRLRSPAEAEPDFAAIRAAEVPVLVVSGGHDEAIETVCDAVAEQTLAERVCFEGAGHAAHKAPGFNQAFEAFLQGCGDS
jgi:pimeloyl-ACP methyl ester carboxylesterase